ncbi:roadblock/LC7 domain-containing protein [Methylomagnum sp.]
MLLSILNELNDTSDSILASSVLSNDGLTLASAFLKSQPLGLDEDNIGAMSCGLMALSRNALGDLTADGVEQILVTGKAGSMLMTQAGSEAILTVVIKPEAEAGSVLCNMRQAADVIGMLVSDNAVAHQ